MINSDLPPAFLDEAEPHKFLSRLKKRASKNFKLTKSSSLENAFVLAYWLYVFGRDDEALEVCRFLGQVEFAGNFNIWSWVEKTLALQSRIVRLRGNKEESRRCVERIETACVVEARLKGSLLDGENGRRDCVRLATESGDKTDERDCRHLLLSELTYVIEVGRPSWMAVRKLENEYSENLVRLREIVGA